MMTEASNIYSRLAVKYNLTEEQVRSAIIYFWRTGVKRSLESIINPEIYINKLGSFKMKDWKLKYVIPSSLALSERLGQHEKNLEYFKLLNERLQEVEKQIIEKRKKLAEFRNHKKDQEYNEYIEKHSKDIRKQETNLGRSKE